MPRIKVLLKCVGQAVCANGLRALAGLVPLGEVLFDVAAGVRDRLRREVGEEQRALWQEAALTSPEEAKQAAAAIAEEVAADQPEAVREYLASYLAQVPAAVRQSLRRPTDPTGLSVPITLELLRPEDLLPLLPARLPRFRSGDRPSGVGDWELVELLGVGGFGEVWKARHRYFDAIAPVALKFCLDPAAKDRLLEHEASVLNRVMRGGRHPGIVPLLDAYLSADPPCLKYEYIEGSDLAGLVRDWPQEPGRPRWQQATRIVQQLAEVVGAAHRLNPPIVHRDLKPANVLVQRAADGSWILRVTDFGIGAVAALPAIRASRQVTSAGNLLATTLRGAHTPLYASPQQMRGEPPDVRDDVHALGVIWYQLLTGDLGSGPPAGLWAEELEEMGLGKELIRLLGACVAARAEKRPADAAVLAEQLGRLLGATPIPKPVRPQPLRPTPSAPADKLQAFLQTDSVTGISWMLDLTGKQIGDAGVQALAASPRLANLTVLILSSNGITDEGVAALAASPHMANLTKLVLWDNQITDAGVKPLVASPFVTNLTALDLGSNRLGDEGVKALAASANLPELAALILVSNQVGDEGALALAASPYLDKLAELKPLLNQITARGVAALRARFGNRVRIY